MVLSSPMVVGRIEESLVSFLLIVAIFLCYLAATK